jgi:AmmeMemoRadiSam system protein A
LAGIVAGAMVAHPPVLIPEVGGRDSQRVVATANALHALDAALAEVPADLVILASPHSTASTVHVFVRRSPVAGGNLSRFRAPQIAVEARVDLEIAERLVAEGSSSGFPLAWSTNSDLDHGVVVPIYFLKRATRTKPFIFLGISGWPLRQFLDFGAWLHGRLADRSALFIASGDLSHRLQHGAPAGFDPAGKKFDETVITALRNQQWERIESLDPDLIEAAGECGLKPLAILLGAARSAGLASRVLNYEGPFGVGYPVVYFGTAPAGLDVRDLALRAIERYLSHGDFIEPGEPVHDLLREPSAVFVTLRKRGEMRGCVGSLHPTQPTAAHEVVHYAVAAAVRDPRFSPVTPDEVKELSVRVQLLAPPEPVSSADELDPKEFGVIVRSGNRQGLLLPALADIATPEQQIAAACDKAGISRYSPLEILRFRTRTID